MLVRPYRWFASIHGAQRLGLNDVLTSSTAPRMSAQLSIYPPK